MLAPQPGLDCCAPGSSCTPASSHSTAVYTWSGSGPLPSPTMVLYAASAAAAPLLLTPLQPSHPLCLPASAQSVAVVISGGARHSWKIESGGDALISGTYRTCQSGGSAFIDVPCSTHDAVAVLPLPVGFARSASISIHVSVSVDYGDAAGLADFGVADDDDEDAGVDDATDGDSGHSAARRNAQLAHGAGLQFDRVGNGPASALQVRALFCFENYFHVFAHAYRLYCSCSCFLWNCCCPLCPLCAASPLASIPTTGKAHGCYAVPFQCLPHLGPTLHLLALLNPRTHTPGYPPTAPLHSLLQIICSCVCASAGACFWREAASSALYFLTLQPPSAALRTNPASARCARVLLLI